MRLVGDDNDDDKEILESLLKWSESIQKKSKDATTAWRPLLETADAQGTSFARQFAGRRRDEALKRIEASYRSYRNKYPELFGYVGLFLLTARCIDEIEWRSRPRPPESRKGQASEKTLDFGSLRHELVSDPAVRQALRELYRPARMEGCDDDTRRRATIAAQEWEKINFESLEFHELGTTSFILHGRYTGGGPDPPEFALKCVLYPYTKFDEIAEATRKYVDEFALKEGRSSEVLHLVDVWASSDTWILMDFAPGQTFNAWLEHALLARAPSRWDRWRSRPLPAHVLKWVRRPLKILMASLPRWLQGWLRGLVRAMATRPVRPYVRLDLLEAIGPKLFDALHELQQELGRGKRAIAHQDLSPRNIIVNEKVASIGIERQTDYEVKLVDLGRNHLYTWRIGMPQGSDARFVAPEVREYREGADSSARVDVYSLGHLLIALGGVGHNQDGTVPDAFYERAPLLARFLEDFIDDDPERRLLLLGDHVTGDKENGETERAVFERAGKLFRQELEAVKAARTRRADFNEEGLFLSLLQLLRPSARSPARLFALVRQRREQERAGLRGGRLNRLLPRWLLLWTLVCTASYWLVTFVIINWTFRDLRQFGINVGLEGSDFPLPLLRDLLNTNEDFPLLDRWRMPGYKIPDFWGNLPARVVGMSFALIGAKYYQTLYASLSPLVAGFRPRAVAAETAMRMYAWWWVPLILAPNLLLPSYWTTATAIGLTGTFFTNWVAASFANNAIARARDLGLTTVPSRQRISGLAMFTVWTPSMLFYALFVWPIAILINKHYLHDVAYYMTAVAGVNIGLFYLVKCGLNGAEVRGGLVRACLAAERVRYLSKPDHERVEGRRVAPSSLK